MNYEKEKVWPKTIETEKPKCKKCGLILDRVMGYVCPDNDCPVFMKVIC